MSRHCHRTEPFAKGDLSLGYAGEINRSGMISPFPGAFQRVSGGAIETASPDIRVESFDE